MLMNSIGVILDINAPKELLKEFMDIFVPDTQPVIIIALGAGSNERKLKLAMELLDKCSPSAVCGRSLDLVAIGEIISEKYDHGDDSSDEEHKKDEEPKKDKERSKSIPFLKTRKLRKTRSPSPGRKNLKVRH